MAVGIEFHVVDSSLVTIKRQAPETDLGWAAVSGLFSQVLVSNGEGVLVVTFEGFVASMAGLGAVARKYGVNLQFGDRMRDLLGRLAAEMAARKTIEQGKLMPFSHAQIDEMLAGTRFARKLRPFQKRDLGHLMLLPHGANFSVPGAGKTTVAYALYELLRTKGTVKQLLVVAPLSAFSAWKDEAVACFTSAISVGVFVDGVPSGCEVILVNYHRLASKYDDLATWVSNGPTHVILDEAHRVKRGREGVHGTAVLDLSVHAVRRDILTGTPAPQSVRDLEPLLDFLWPGQAKHILPRVIDDDDVQTDVVETVRKRLAPLYVRTNKNELRLPKYTINVERVPMRPLQKAFYDALKGELVGSFALGSRDRQRLRDLGRAVMYLIEAATNPLLVPVGSSEEDLPMFQHPPLEIAPGSNLALLLSQYHLYETPAKIHRCIQIVRETAVHGKVLLWTTFRRNIAMLERMLADLEPALIHGGVFPEDGAPVGTVRTREAEIARFHNDIRCKVLIANPAACAEGVSLHRACHHAVFLDRTFNAGQFLQALDRIHRLGLPDDQETTYSILLSSGTIDETIDARVGAKARRLGSLLDDPELSMFALPTEEDGIEEMDHLDMQQVLEHLHGNG